MEKYKIKFHIPTQQYGFMEIEGTENDIEEMKEYYNRYAETPIDFNRQDRFKKIETFTGEFVLYNDIDHEYTDLEGNPLLSGSKYKKGIEEEFDLERISEAVGKKFDIDQQEIKDMWKGKSKISCEFGDAIHDSMEQYFKYKGRIKEKEYHLPSHEWLRNVVLSYPLKDEDIMPEVLVSDVKNKMVGRIDGIWITGDKKCVIIDYKSDGKIKKNVDGHFNQLSFYAHILQNFGWEVEKLLIYNFTDKWYKYESEVLELK